MAETAVPAPRYGNICLYLGNLDNEEGNAYVVMGRVQNALKEHGVEQREIEEYIRESTSGDYEHLLATVHRWVTASYKRTR